MIVWPAGSRPTQGVCERCGKPLKARDRTGRWLGEDCRRAILFDDIRRSAYADEPMDDSMEPLDEWQPDADLIAEIEDEVWEADDPAPTPEEAARREAVRLRLAEKLRPDRFSSMSGRMAAVVSYVIRERGWSEPEIAELVISSDGAVLAAHRGELGANTILGSRADLDRNFVSLIEAARLDEEEIVEIGRLQRRRIRRW